MYQMEVSDLKTFLQSERRRLSWSQVKSFIEEIQTKEAYLGNGNGPDEYPPSRFTITNIISIFFIKMYNWWLNRMHKKFIFIRVQIFCLRLANAL